MKKFFIEPFSILGVNSSIYAAVGQSYLADFFAARLEWATKAMIERAREQAHPVAPDWESSLLGDQLQKWAICFDPKAPHKPTLMATINRALVRQWVNRREKNLRLGKKILRFKWRTLSYTRDYLTRG